jgi:SAM-dependent methyltransferase
MNVLKERFFGSPIPPPDKREKVIGVRDVDLFLDSGEETADIIRDVLDRQKMTLRRAGPVLDFGCGVGRVLRHFRKDDAELHGTDYNAELVGWCQDNLSFAEFRVNQFEGPLSYEDASLGVVYAWSVFTHLTDAQQLRWIVELRRVLRPGGFLIFTTQGEDYLANYWKLYKRHLEGSGKQEYLQEIIEKHGLDFLESHTPLNEDQTQRFWNGELIVLAGEEAGKNECAAFHPEPYVRSILAQDFAIVELLRGGAGGGSRQDVWVFRKPARVQSDLQVGIL